MSGNNPAAPAAPAAAPAEQASQAPVENNAEVAEVLEAEGQEPEVEVPAAKEQKSTKRKLKIKVDGQELEEEYDPNDEDYMRRQLQLAKMSQKRASETAELRKQIEEIADYLSQAKGDKKKLRALIKELGADEKELAAAIIEEEIENSKKSPEQLEREQLQRELQELKESREREEKDRKAKDLERLQEQEMERYDMLVSKAIESSDLPKKPYVVKKIADYMLLALENGIDVTPDEIMPLVREEIHSDLQELVRALGEDKVEDFIGKDILGKIRKKNIAKAKSSQPAVPVKSAIPDAGGKTPEPKGKEKINYKKFFGV